MQLDSASESVQSRLEKLEQEAMIIRDLKNEKRTLLNQVGQLTERIKMLEGRLKQCWTVERGEGNWNR